MADLIQARHDDTVVSLFLNRPRQKNALSLDLLGELSDALSTEPGDDTTAVILSGGAECFSAGADINELSGTIEDLGVDDAIETVTGKIRALPVPVIAAIEGPCLGGAFDLALSCDQRIASEDAFFQVPVARLGLLYNPRSIARMHNLLGRDALVRMLIMGERIDAAAAREAGIVSVLTPAGESHEAALAAAQTTADNISSSVAATKGLLNAFESGDYDPEYWQEVRRQTLSSPERRKAILGAQARLSEKTAGRS